MMVTRIFVKSISSTTRLVVGVRFHGRTIIFESHTLIIRYHALFQPEVSSWVFVADITSCHQAET